jgi:uncharacterized membrane protein YedE/YeeE
MEEVLPWYIAGPLIGLIVPLLILLREKQFGVSSSYRYIGSKLFKNIDYFKGQSGSDKWQFQFAIGLILAGIYSLYAGVIQVDAVVDSTTQYSEIAHTIYSESNIVYFFFGGIFVGFGARYANGCTAGHCIMGVAQFSISSLIATVCFFIGGLFASYVLIPLIF